MVHRKLSSGSPCLQIETLNGNNKLTISILYDFKNVDRPSEYCRMMVLSIEPDSSSIRSSPLVRASKPSWPCAMYSLVIILYFLVPISLLIGSSSKGKVPRLFSALDFSNQIPNRRFPGFRRESQDTRKPDITGNRLFYDELGMDGGSNIPLTLPGQAKFSASFREHPIMSRRQSREQRWNPRTGESPIYLRW